MYILHHFFIAGELYYLYIRRKIFLALCFVLILALLLW